MPNHNGGHLAFGPDGFLYIGTGDGGGGGDPDGNAQNLDSLLGKILRIDVNSRAPGKQYGIPRDNPFAGGGGRARDLRLRPAQPVALLVRPRPRRHLDRGRRPERHRGGRLPPARRRARASTSGGTPSRAARPSTAAGPCRAARRWRPVAQYTHDEGCSITGGYVYRGTRVPALRGRYVFADFCSGKLWTMRAGPKPGAQARRHRAPRRHALERHRRSARA